MISKYYSLDECSTQDEVFSHLESLQDDGKIYFEIIDLDVIKFKDLGGLTAKEIKDLSKFLYENDVIEYPDYRKDGYYDDDDDFEDDFEDNRDDYEDEY
jgi:hypothetical protein